MTVKEKIIVDDVLKAKAAEFQATLEAKNVDPERIKKLNTSFTPLENTLPTDEKFKTGEAYWHSEEGKEQFAHFRVPVVGKDDMNCSCSSLSASCSRDSQTVAAKGGGYMIKVKVLNKQLMSLSPFQLAAYLSNREFTAIKHSDVKTRPFDSEKNKPATYDTDLEAVKKADVKDLYELTEV